MSLKVAQTTHFGGLNYRDYAAGRHDCLCSYIGSSDSTETVILVVWVKADSLYPCCVANYFSSINWQELSPFSSDSGFS